jgi:dihydrofolate reductase
MTRKLIVSQFLSLDGVMQAPGYPDEDRRGGFRQGGWISAYVDETFGDAISNTLAETDVLLLGRRTYEIFAAHWPKQPPQDPLASRFNELAKVVVSSTMREPLEWRNSTLIRTDQVREIAQIKKRPGRSVTVIGSGELVQTLMRDGLVDEYRLMIHPIVLGSGTRMFRESSSPVRLELIESNATSTGVLIVTYRPMSASTQTGSRISGAGA